MEDSETRLEERAKPLRSRLLRWRLEGEPSNLRACRARINSGPESCGHQLRSKADAEGRPALFQSPANQRDFVSEKWIVCRIVDAYWTSKNDQKVSG